MLKFNEFLNEQSDSVIEVDDKHLSNNKDTINAELDVLTEKPYQNAPILLNQLRGCFERFGVLLPAEMTPQFLNLSAELVYQLGESGYNLYIVYDTNEDGFVDAYAQIVDDDELDDLMSADLEDKINSDRDPETFRPSTWYAKRDDDSGDTSEYA